MKAILMVGLGGCIGSIARYKFGGYILHRLGDWTFPLSTFSVNALGCLVIGALAGSIEKHNFMSTEARLFLFTGVLGGFTTFSAFSYEGVFLFRRGEPVIALLYAMLSVVTGFAAVWLGLRVCGSQK